MNTLYELLLFPDRAENLGQFAAYEVDLEHWKSLSAVFRTIFRTVYERGSSAVLLVHGAQGTGKTLFSRRLVQDFDATTKGANEPDRTNLWHTLVR
jgi:Cdc6-like AAA superfamily ATPase